MNFLTAYNTDVGIRKKTNQDSLLIEQASTDHGNILFAAVCDGMGGLSKGEVASGSLAKRLSEWFRTEFPRILEEGFSPEVLRVSLDDLILDANESIGLYGSAQGIVLGTTCAAFLAIDDCYYIMNIGDSRIYLVSNMLYQLTRDQTYVQREIDCGRMTPQQAAVDPNRSVLLQCVGASDSVLPDFFVGNLEPGQCFLLCSDGFTHVISPDEICYTFLSDPQSGTEEMRNGLVELTELCKSRLEKDNITAILIKTL